MTSTIWSFLDDCLRYRKNNPADPDLALWLTTGTELARYRDETKPIGEDEISRATAVALRGNKVEWSRRGGFSRRAELIIINQSNIYSIVRLFSCPLLVEPAPPVSSTTLFSCRLSFSPLGLLLPSYHALVAGVSTIGFTFLRLRRSAPTAQSLRSLCAMGFFDHLQKGGGFSLQPKKPQIRKVVTQTRPAVPARTSSAAASPAPAASSRSAVRQSKARPVSGDSRQNTPQKRLGTAGKIRKRPSPAQRLSSDDDDSDTDTSFEVRKRARVSASAEPDPDRRVRDTEMFSEKGKESFRMVHAADIASLEKPGKFKRAFDKTDKPVDVWLQYPGASQKERYAICYLLSCSSIGIRLETDGEGFFADTSSLCRATKTTSDPSTISCRLLRWFPRITYPTMSGTCLITTQPESSVV